MNEITLQNVRELWNEVSKGPIVPDALPEYVYFEGVKYEIGSGELKKVIDNWYNANNKTDKSNT